MRFTNRANICQRPFANYYGPVFILYELSSPFLNIHWFCDKLNLTGSKLQWYNGMVLLFTFFSCRIVWGTYQSARVYYDVWQILNVDVTTLINAGVDVESKRAGNIFATRNGELCLGDRSCVAAQGEVMKFVGPDSELPYWLIVVYLVSNVVLNALNWYWFSKMIETVRKRFEGKPAPGDEDDEKLKRRKSVVEHAADTLDRETLTGPVTPFVEKSQSAAMGLDATSSGRDAGDLNKRR